MTNDKHWNPSFTGNILFTIALGTSSALTCSLRYVNYLWDIWGLVDLITVSSHHLFMDLQWTLELRPP
jgi:hypothetical protein